MARSRIVWHMKTKAGTLLHGGGLNLRRWEIQAEVDHTHRRRPHQAMVCKRKHALSSDQHADVNIAITHTLGSTSQTWFRHRWPPSKITLPLIEIEMSRCSDIVKESGIGTSTVRYRRWDDDAGITSLHWTHSPQAGSRRGVTRLNSVVVVGPTWRFGSSRWFNKIQFYPHRAN